MALDERTESSMPAYYVRLRRGGVKKNPTSGAKVGEFGPFTTRELALRQGQALADSGQVAAGVKVTVEPAKPKANGRKKAASRKVDLSDPEWVEADKFAAGVRSGLIRITSQGNENTYGVRTESGQSVYTKDLGVYLRPNGRKKAAPKRNSPAWARVSDRGYEFDTSDRGDLFVRCTEPGCRWSYWHKGKSAKARALLTQKAQEHLRDVHGRQVNPRKNGRKRNPFGSYRGVRYYTTAGVYRVKLDDGSTKVFGSSAGGRKGMEAFVDAMLGGVKRVANPPRLPPLAEWTQYASVAPRKYNYETTHAGRTYKIAYFQTKDARGYVVHVTPGGSRSGYGFAAILPDGSEDASGVGVSFRSPAAARSAAGKHAAKRPR